MQQILTDNNFHLHDEQTGFISTYLPPHYSWARHNSVVKSPTDTSPHLYATYFWWFSCRICIWLRLTLFALQLTGTSSHQIRLVWIHAVSEHFGHKLQYTC
jgi:hypothetical protein